VQKRGNLMALNVVGVSNGAGFVVLGAEKILMRGYAPGVGQFMLSSLSTAGLSNAG
jgi:hypothetical protein